MYPVSRMNGDKLQRNLKESGTFQIVLGQWMENMLPSIDIKFWLLLPHILTWEVTLGHPLAMGNSFDITF